MSDPLSRDDETPSQMPPDGPNTTSRKPKEVKFQRNDQYCLPPRYHFRVFRAILGQLPEKLGTKGRKTGKQAATDSERLPEHLRDIVVHFYRRYYLFNVAKVAHMPAPVLEQLCRRVGMDRLSGLYAQEKNRLRKQGRSKLMEERVWSCDGEDFMSSWQEWLYRPRRTSYLWPRDGQEFDEMWKRDVSGDDLDDRGKKLKPFWLEWVNYLKEEQHIWPYDDNKMVLFWKSLKKDLNCTRSLPENREEFDPFWPDWAQWPREVVQTLSYAQIMRCSLALSRTREYFGRMAMVKLNKFQEGPELDPDYWPELEKLVMDQAQEDAANIDLRFENLGKNEGANRLRHIANLYQTHGMGRYGSHRRKLYLEEYRRCREYAWLLSLIDVRSTPKPWVDPRPPERDMREFLSSLPKGLKRLYNEREYHFVSSFISVYCRDIRRPRSQARTLGC